MRDAHEHLLAARHGSGRSSRRMTSLPPAPAKTTARTSAPSVVISRGSVDGAHERGAARRRCDADEHPAHERASRARGCRHHRRGRDGRQHGVPPRHRRGRDVVLLERETLASGSTSRSAGGARLQFADELNVRLSLRSLDEFERWDALIGEHVEFVPDIAFHQVGYLFLLDTPELVATFREALAVQHSQGVPSRELTPAEAAAIVPQLELDGVLAATFCPRDGHMSPEAVVQGYAAAAVARGARVLQACPATGIEHARRPHHRGAHRARARSPPTRSCARPAHGRARSARWSASRSRCTASRGTCGSRPSRGGLRDDLPLTIDFSTSFYFHREGPGIVFGGREAALEDVAEHALRAPAADPRAADPEQLVGLLRGQPRPQRDRGRVVGARALPVRDGLLRPRLPAVARRSASTSRSWCAASSRRSTSSAFALERFARGEQRAERFVV